jgi:hypothetical protein
MGLWQKLKSAGSAVAVRATAWRRHPRIVAASAGAAAIFGGLGFILDVASVSSLVFGNEQAKSVQAAAPPKTLRVNYMRTFGGLRTNALMLALHEGGFQEGSVDAASGILSQSALYISGELPQFFESWEHKDVAPLKNPLWDTLTDLEDSFNTFYVAAFPYNDITQRENCAHHLYLGSEVDFPGMEACGEFENIEQRVGFLFAIFDVPGDVDLGKIEFTLVEAAAETNRQAWSSYTDEELASFCADATPAGLEALGFNDAVISRKVLPFAKADASYLWPLAAYRVVEDDPYSGTLLSAYHLPACISVEGAIPTPVRAPLRGAANTIEIPFGWYYQ